MPNFANMYAAFRGSKTFLVALGAFVAMWLMLHWLDGFDSDFALLNTVLSIEAAVAMAFFTMVSDKQNDAQVSQSNELEAAVDEIERIGQASLDVAVAVRQILEENTKLLGQLITDHEVFMQLLVGKEKTR
jgi:low affinity Fe/Cu permease